MFGLDNFRDKTKMPYHPMACLISLKIRNQNNVGCKLRDFSSEWEFSPNILGTQKNF